MLADLLGGDRGLLLLRRADEIPADTQAAFDERVSRRARREPFQHIVGHVGFHGLVLRCDARALVPRPETEGLVDAVLDIPPHEGARIVDLGTGSGCIAIALAAARPDLRVLALERSAPALALAAENVLAQGVGERVRLRRGDIAAPPAEWTGCVDIVASNPPYVAESEWDALAPEVRDHDPRGALLAGRDGLEAYRVLAPAAAALLRPAGWLVVELGAGQDRAVREIVDGAGFEVRETRADPAGIPRVLVAQRHGSRMSGGVTEA